MRILILGRYVTEMPLAPPFYPRAAVNGDFFEFMDWGSTLPWVIHVQSAAGDYGTEFPKPPIKNKFNHGTIVGWKRNSGPAVALCGEGLLR